MVLSMSIAARFHLAVYNQIQGIGWLVILCDICLRGPWMAWARLGTLVIGLQGVVLFDVVHAACGMWPSDPNLGMLQRLWCKVGHRSEVFVTLLCFAQTATLDAWIGGFLLFTWALADVSRFQLYFCRTLDRSPPYWLKWLRYSDFIVQYPLVLIAEATIIGTVHLTASGRCWMAIVCVAAGLFGASAANSLPTLLFGLQNAMLSMLVVLLLALHMPGYAPLAIGFQIYEWLIFVPAYQTLMRARAKRLNLLGDHVVGQYDRCVMKTSK